MQKIHFAHPYVTVATSRGRHIRRRITVAYLVDGNNCTYNYSVCAPADQFNKKLGRVIAAGRLEKHPVTFVLETPPTKATWEEIVEQIVETISNSELPNYWAGLYIS